MNNLDPNSAAQMLQGTLKPWYDSIENPQKAQETILHQLLLDYAKTTYGQKHSAAQITSLEDYRLAFPIATYDDYKPLIEKDMSGASSGLLWEEPLGWAITRGTTKGESKFIPMTPTDMRIRISAGRAMLNYVAMTKRFDLFTGVNCDG